MVQDNDFSSQPAYYREKILPLFHPVVSSHISLFFRLKTEALSYEHTNFYISLLLGTIQALWVPDFQRTLSLHENSPGHIIIPITLLSDISCLRQPGHSCVHFLQVRCQHWQCGIDPSPTMWTCCQAVPTVPASLCFEKQHSSALEVSVFLCGLLDLCGFYSGLPFICPTLGANVVCIQELHKQRM